MTAYFYLFVLSFAIIITNSSASVTSIDSDYLCLEVKPTLLPFDGVGVFAKRHIPANSLLCEYSGLLVPKSYAGDKTRAFEMPDFDDFIVLGDTLCAEINDSTWVINHPLTREEVSLLSRSLLPEGPIERVLPTYPGFTRNAAAVIVSGKIFIMSTRDIAKGEEIYFYYGLLYWIKTLADSVTSLTPYGIDTLPQRDPKYVTTYLRYVMTE